jgi:hypothetical protein
MIRILIIGLALWFIGWLFSFTPPRWIFVTLVVASLFIGLGWLIGIGIHIGMGGGY